MQIERVEDLREGRFTASAVLDVARTTMGSELERFAANTLEYIRQEGHLLVDDPDIPAVQVDAKPAEGGEPHA